MNRHGHLPAASQFTKPSTPALGLTAVGLGAWQGGPQATETKPSTCRNHIGLFITTLHRTAPRPDHVGLQKRQAL